MVQYDQIKFMLLITAFLCLNKQINIAHQTHTLFVIQTATVNTHNSILNDTCYVQKWSFSEQKYDVFISHKIRIGWPKNSKLYLNKQVKNYVIDMPCHRHAICKFFREKSSAQNMCAQLKSI